MAVDIMYDKTGPFKVAVYTYLVVVVILSKFSLHRASETRATDISHSITFLYGRLDVLWRSIVSKFQMGCRHAAVTSWRYLAAASQKARFQLKISNYTVIGRFRVPFHGGLPKTNGVSPGFFVIARQIYISASKADFWAGENLVQEVGSFLASSGRLSRAFVA